jgi:hypothetical protein
VYSKKLFKTEFTGMVRMDRMKREPNLSTGGKPLPVFGFNHPEYPVHPCESDLVSGF